MTHNVVYLFSTYHGEVITPNLGSYQADMTISPSDLNRSKLLKYYQKITTTDIAVTPMLRSNNAIKNIVKYY